MFDRILSAAAPATEHGLPEWFPLIPICLAATAAFILVAGALIVWTKPFVFDDDDDGEDDNW